MNSQKRRLFLKQITFGTFFISLFAPLKSIMGFSKNTHPSWMQLLEIAKWCPTVHNLQPQKIKIVSKETALLYYDPTRLLPEGDPNSVFATVAMGIFIEHLSIAASCFNYKVDITQVFDNISIHKKNNTVFAKLQLSKRRNKEEIDSKLIKKRRTSRIKYDGTPISKSLVATIKNECEKFNNEFFYSSEKKLISIIKKINQEALFEDLDNDALREELNHLFRYNKKDAELKQDGLWAKCMGFAGALLKSVFQNHKKWEKGIRKHFLKETYISSFKGTASIGWFGGQFKNTDDYLNCGKMMARCWLLITKKGAYIQPFGSLVTNPKANKKINRAFTQPSTGKDIWMVFRVGYSKLPARSYRLETKDYLINL